jgi:hypothetical protein
VHCVNTIILEFPDFSGDIVLIQAHDTGRGDLLVPN